MSTPHGFWVEYTDNRAFDGIVTSHLAAHGDIVVIHGFHDSDVYLFSDIVRRLHRLKPGIRVLFYTWAGRKRLGATSIAAVPTLMGWKTCRSSEKRSGRRSNHYKRPDLHRSGSTHHQARDWFRDRNCGSEPRR
jgi:hypothetical protein